MVGENGYLAISFPQEFTRPSAETERRELVELAGKLGLTLKVNLCDFTEYSVPRFEEVAYRCHGIVLNRSWRKGDLFVFVRTGGIQRDIDSMVEKTPKWNQYARGGARVFLKRDGRCEEGAPSIKHVLGMEDLRYNSTSSRMAAWQNASLVSSRNCIAHADGRKALSGMLPMCLEGSGIKSENLGHGGTE